MTLFSEFKNLMALSLLSFLDKKEWDLRVPFNVLELLNLSLSDEPKKDFTPGHFVWHNLKNSFGVKNWFSYGWLRLYSLYRPIYIWLRLYFDASRFKVPPIASYAPIQYCTCSSFLHKYKYYMKWNKILLFWTHSQSFYGPYHHTK